MRGAGILRDAWCSRPRSVLIVILRGILNNWDALAFDTLMDQMLSIHISSCLFKLFI